MCSRDSDPGGPFPGCPACAACPHLRRLALPPRRGAAESGALIHSESALAHSRPLTRPAGERADLQDALPATRGPRFADR